VLRVSTMIEEISQAGHGQTVDIEQVNQAVLHMDQSTQQNAALVEEAATAATALQQQAQALKQVVSAFHLSDKS
jgi:methyl-accepting chemotaxis protein